MDILQPKTLPARAYLEHVCQHCAGLRLVVTRYVAKTKSTLDSSVPTGLCVTCEYDAQHAVFYLVEYVKIAHRVLSERVTWV